MDGTGIKPNSIQNYTMLLVSYWQIQLDKLVWSIVIDIIRVEQPIASIECYVFRFDIEPDIWEIRNCAESNCRLFMTQNLMPRWRNVHVMTINIDDNDFIFIFIFLRVFQGTRAVRVTTHTGQELWPWHCESPKESVERLSQDTSEIT
jgi:hypothetical protein